LVVRILYPSPILPEAASFSIYLRDASRSLTPIAFGLLPFVKDFVFPSVIQADPCPLFGDLTNDLLKAADPTT